MHEFFRLPAALLALLLSTDDPIFAKDKDALLSAPPLSTGGTSIARKTIGIAPGTDRRPGNPACVNIVHYGGDRTGASASDAAFESAVAASRPGSVCVYLPAGTYRFHTAHAIGLSSAIESASITIRGDGPDVTNLSFLRGTSGMAISLNQASHSFHIRDLSVLGGAYSARTTGIAVVQNAVVPNPAYAAQSDISSVNVRGTDGYAKRNGFGTGIALLKNSNVNLINDYVIGTGAATARCITLAGTTDTIAVVFNLIGTVANSCAVGLYYGFNVQGVSITSSNMTGNRTGIYSPPDAPNMGQLAISASQFANVDFDLNLQTDPGGTTISNSYFLANARATPGHARINIAAAKNTAITGNVFQGIADINAIVVQTYASPWSMFIGGNTFNQFATAIWLQDGSQNVTVGINSFAGTKNDILNSGRNNLIPARSCSSTPTSRFAVLNGVVVHC